VFLGEMMYNEYASVRKERPGAPPHVAAENNAKSATGKMAARGEKAMNTRYRAADGVGSPLPETVLSAPADTLRSPSAGIQPVPQRRIIEKMDEYMSRRDYAGAEKHLLYWLEEARLGGDLRGMLMLRNELVGHYRKTGERDKALASAEDALALLKRLDFENTLSAATTYVNVATACSAFGDNERALALFEKARPIYEHSAAAQPALLGGLYNNMALSCAAVKRFEEAFALYDRAMAQMARAPHGALEQAITCLNMANAVEEQQGMERGETQIFELLDRACALLDTPTVPREGYYAFVCEKCAPTFEYYGYFSEANTLKERSRQIYERA